MCVPCPLPFSASNPSTLPRRAETLARKAGCQVQARQIFGLPHEATGVPAFLSLSTDPAFSSTRAKAFVWAAWFLLSGREAGPLTFWPSHSEHRLRSGFADAVVHQCSACGRAQLRNTPKVWSDTATASCAIRKHFKRWRRRRLIAMPNRARPE